MSVNINVSENATLTINGITPVAGLGLTLLAQPSQSTANVLFDDYFADTFTVNPLTPATPISLEDIATGYVLWLQTDTPVTLLLGQVGGLTKASLSLQSLIYTAKIAGTSGNSISVAYTTGGVAGSEVVTVIGTAITVQIQSGVSTPAQIAAAIAASPAASALVTVTVGGYGMSVSGYPSDAPVNAGDTLQLNLNGDGLRTIVLSASGTPGTSTSGLSPATSVAMGDTLIIDINGSGEAQMITFPTALSTGVAIAAEIQTLVRALTAANPTNQPAYNNFTATYTGTQYILTAGTVGDLSSVEVTANVGVAAALKLGVANGGVEAMGSSAPASIAANIQALVRALTANTPANQLAYSNFTAAFNNSIGQYILTSGLAGPTSAVVVTPNVGDALLLELGVGNGGVETTGNGGQVAVGATLLSGGTNGSPLTSNSFEVDSFLFTNCTFTSLSIINGSATQAAHINLVVAGNRIANPGTPGVF